MDGDRFDDPWMDDDAEALADGYDVDGEPFDPDDLDDWYDDPRTVAKLDRWGAGDGSPQSVFHAEDPDHVGTAPAFASRLNSWTRRTALGAVMQGMALGLQEVFEPKDQATIVIEVDDDGLPHDLPVQLLLDPDDPRGSLALVRRTGVKPPEV